MTNQVVWIRKEELNRIQEYVSEVAHRVTGGLLLGYNVTRADATYLLITRVTTRVPEQYISGKKNCIDHPPVTAADVTRALADTPDARFLGRWHSHLDGVNRPSSIDMDWAMRTFNDRSLAPEELLHFIVIAGDGAANLFSYVATRERMTFQKVSWREATRAEMDEVRYNRPPPPSSIQPETMVQDAPVFSMKKARELLEDDRQAVESLPQIRGCTLNDDGRTLSMLVEMEVHNDTAILQFGVQSLYPVQPPSLQTVLNGRVFDYKPRLLQQWTSACRLQDVVVDVYQQLKRVDVEQMLPPPKVDERDPVRREVAILRTAGYQVQTLPTERAGTLIVVSSELLEQAGKLFCAVLPPTYPADAPAWALTQRGIPIDQVEFENLKEVPPYFTLLTFLEKQFPAARRYREAAARKVQSSAGWLLLFYLFLFLGAGGAGYFWQATNQLDVETAWSQALDTIRRAFGTQAGGMGPLFHRQASPPAQKILLHPREPVVAVVMDAGKNTNLSTAEAKWATSTALQPLPVICVHVDLQNQAHGLELLKDSLKGAQLVLLYTYNAGDKQLEFVNALRPFGLPLGVVSMAAGPKEDALRQTAIFYRMVALPGGKSGAQRTLLDLKKDGVLEIK